MQFSISTALDQAIRALWEAESSAENGGAREAHQTLRERYRSQVGSQFKNQHERIIYLLSRLPQTTLVLQEILRALQPVVGNARHFRDFGAGPANLLWALDSLKWDTKSIVLIERDQAMQNIGKHLLSLHPRFGGDRVPILWDHAFDAGVDQTPVDVTVASYSLGEVPESARSVILNALWHATESAMVIIEPGSPQGFGVIKKLRSELIEKGAFIHAPCTHESVCPMAPHDWCHFKLNCVRPAFLRQAKQASLGYEEENYSYLVAIKKLQPPSYGRVVRVPIKRSGHVSLDLCTQDGLKRITISKKERALYKAARKLSLGDSVEQPYREPSPHEPE